MCVQIDELTEDYQGEWDEFVRNCPNALFLHLFGWKRVIEKTYGHKAYYLTARQGGELRGVLPLFRIKSRLLGNAIASLPGGVCTEDNEAALCLINAAIELACYTGSSFAVVRDSSHNWDSPLIRTSVYQRMILELPAGSDQLWRQISPKSRNKVRQAGKWGLQVTYTIENLEAFHNVLTRNFRRLGTPAFGLSLLRNVVGEFSENCIAPTIVYEGKVIGGLFLFNFRNEVYNPWASSDPRFFAMRPNNLLYWEVLKRSCEHGYRIFDFGRSRVHAGTFQFKEQWGAKPHTIQDLYFLNTISEVPEPRLMMERHAFYRVMPEIWKILPLWFTRWLGPKLHGIVPVST